jgi:hypothetical protein
MSNFIIQHPNTFSLPAYNEQYKAGTINSLARQTCHKLVNISSCVRQLQLPSIFRPCNNIKDYCTDNTCGSCDNCCYLKKWSSTNFNVYLPETLDKVVKMSLSALEIPNTIYSISQYNQTNVFQIIVNNKTFIIEIPAGNYEIDQLVTVINNIIQTCNLSNIYAGYDSISGRFFFYSDDSNVSFDLDFSLPNNHRNIKLNLGWMLGFRRKKYCFNNSYVNKADVWTMPPSSCAPNNDKNWPCRKYISCPNNLEEISINGLWPTGEFPYGFIAEGIVDISGPKFLFLLVNDFNNNVNTKYISLSENGASISASNILARISLPYGKNEIGYDDASDLIPKTREYFGPVTIEKLHIKLVDDLGRIVDLNKNEVCLLIDFEYLYNL